MARFMSLRTCGSTWHTIMIYRVGLCLDKHHKIARTFEGTHVSAPGGPAPMLALQIGFYLGPQGVIRATSHIFSYSGCLHILFFLRNLGTDLTPVSSSFRPFDTSSQKDPVNIYTVQSRISILGIYNMV